MAILTLTTDFGYQDSYVGEMKGVILSRDPSIQIVDIAHGITNHNISAAINVLRRAMPEFPEGTIHIAVIDPGVGSARRRLIAEIEMPIRGSSAENRSMYFVGPDNGLLPALICSGCKMRAYEIANAELVPGISQRFTFDGRDVFTPAALQLAKGVELDRFGPPVNRLIEISELKYNKTEKGLEGAIVNVDTYGNLISNIPAFELGVDLHKLRVVIDGQDLPIIASYSELPNSAAGAIINSAGVLEIAVNQGNAANLLGLEAGAQLFVYFA